MTKHPSHTPTHPIRVKITLNKHKFLRMTKQPSHTSNHKFLPMTKHPSLTLLRTIRVKITLKNHTFIRMTKHPSHTHTFGARKRQDKTRHDKTPRPHFHHFFGVILTQPFLTSLSDLFMLIRSL